MTNKIQKGTTIAALALATALAGAQGISVTVDGKPVNFSTTGPRSIDGRVLVPLRGVFEEMGAYVQWDASRREVSANRGDSRVMLHIGDRNAMVDGRNVTLDVPAMIVDGATMVPIRFLSESLGAEVHWSSAERLVAIATSDDGRAQRINDQNRDWNNRDQVRNDRWYNGRQTVVLQDNTVIPVTLDQELSSNRSRRGDRFTATVRTNTSDYYGFLPEGAQIEGTIVTARPQRGNDPGVLELDFQRLRMPNGHSYNIDGRLVSLDANGISRGNNGMLRATGSAARDNRTVYAGYGAGAGLIVGLLTKRPLEGTVIGGLIGYIAGQNRNTQRNPRNVRLAPGTQFGVRLTQDVTINQRDFRDWNGG